MNREQRLLITAGLALVIAGLLFGFVYGYFVQHGTLLVLKESHRAALRSAATGDWGSLRKSLQTGAEINYQLLRAVDVHTHLVKVATWVVLAGLFWPLLGWQKIDSRLVALALLGGAVFFPMGVFAEIYTHSVLAKALAAGGATLVILSSARISSLVLRQLENPAKLEERPPRPPVSPSPF